ncbi:MAG: AAA family ATPase [Candidatus Marsarchaeota archaeon]|nr:AAA family ATPase [Candidatus Marsarchaeota archaeon]
MLYLDRLTLHNFKSFRHANVSFSNGFNCIVGPNGSGKSNLCDSLLFALGESSLRRMRVTATANLINGTVKPDPETHLKRSYVTVMFSDGSDKHIEVSRIVRSNSKISYRLDGKRVHRQDIMDVLDANNCNINETNTITQGEITRILNYNAKERRGLLDVAAGIKEFDDKKESSLKELGKVEDKISNAKVMLGEREGFLNELKKEKDDAERYIALTDSVKRMNYSLLKKRELQLAKEYGEAADKLSRFGETRTGIERRISSLGEEANKLGAERSDKSQKLSERSLETSSAGKKLEEINASAATVAAQSDSLSKELSAGKERIELQKSERKRIKSQIGANEAELQAVKAQIDERSSTLKSLGVGPEEAEEALAAYEEHQKRVDSATEEEEALQRRLASANARSQQLESESKGIGSQIASLSEELSASEKRAQDAKASSASVAKRISDAKESISAIMAEEEKLQKERARLDEQVINVRESLALYGGSQDRAAAALSSSIKQGFYGRAYELCSFDDKYSNAVSAAAGSRLNYFIVDSIDVAKRCIETIKQKGLGRSTFIPLRELSVKLTERASGQEPLINFVKFDKKFAQAFEYVFSNTFLVPSVDAAQKIGVGKHRFVTLDGELIEQSGAITGGQIKAMQFPGKLQAELKSLEEERAGLAKSLLDISARVDSAKKALSALEIESMNYGIELKHAGEASETALTALKELNARGSSLSSQMLAAQKELNSLESAIRDAAKRKSAARAARDALHSALASSQKGTEAQDGASKAMSSGIRKEIEQLMMRQASLAKENEMLAARDSELEAELVKLSRDADQAKDSIASLKERQKGLLAQKGELEKKLKSHDELSSSLYKELSELDKRISELGFERGERQAELDKLNRELMLAESAKMQLETRLGDIKAELATYPAYEEMPDSPESLEKRLVIAKSDIERLGNVNLKAPEMYEVRKRDVDEAEAKLQVLDNERNSVLSMINEIESKKLAVFMETFRSVNENFRQLYSYIFDGEASLVLENPKEPFESGLKISMQDKFKKTTEQLSGGEKSLLILILIFAIQMRNPMSFYIFDEIDAALDKENSKKLSMLIKQMSSRSQFVVVSHNDSLISAAETAMGVALQNGESKVIGIQLVGPGTPESAEKKKA